MTGTGVSTTFGTFGELVQGVLPGRRDFLVTLPIARWSTATFQIEAGRHQVAVRPAHKWKAERLAALVLDALRPGSGGTLTIDSTLPEGKGLGSSSADLVAAARATSNALDRPLSLRALEDLLRRIEPTDGVLYPGIVAFEHKRVRLLAKLGSLPTMAIVAVDEGGMVDTVEFNRIAKPFTAADRREYAAMLDRLTVAVAAGDLGTVGAVATRSAEMNQILRPKRTLDQVVGVCRDVHGLGVVAAHSGTMIGILLDVRDPGYHQKVTAAIAACSPIAGGVFLYRTLDFTTKGSAISTTMSRGPV